MKITFGEFYKLIEEALTYDNIVFLTKPYFFIEYIAPLTKGILLGNSATKDGIFIDNSSTIKLNKDRIEIHTDNYAQTNIAIYKNRVTTEELINTLEFLRND